MSQFSKRSGGRKTTGNSDTAKLPLSLSQAIVISAAVLLLVLLYEVTERVALDVDATEVTVHPAP